MWRPDPQTSHALHSRHRLHVRHPASSQREMEAAKTRQHIRREKTHDFDQSLDQVTPGVSKDNVKEFAVIFFVTLETAVY